MQALPDCCPVARNSKKIDALNNPIGNANEVLVLWIVREVVIGTPGIDGQVFHMVQRCES
jgi:hypothetical protein